jgi:hypothetical protein
MLLVLLGDERRRKKNALHTRQLARSLLVIWGVFSRKRGEI